MPICFVDDHQLVWATTILIRLLTLSFFLFHAFWQLQFEFEFLTEIVVKVFDVLVLDSWHFLFLLVRAWHLLHRLLSVDLIIIFYNYFTSKLINIVSDHAAGRRFLRLQINILKEILPLDLDVFELLVLQQLFAEERRQIVAIRLGWLDGARLLVLAREVLLLLLQIIQINHVL